MAEGFGAYVATRKLGAGGQATTWLGHRDDAPDDRVLIKVFHTEVAEDWKSVELFERSAEVLEGLDHPGIPTYRDHFEATPDGPGEEILFCLVRDFVDGESLQERIEAGRSYDEAEVVDIAGQLLDILAYLHGQSPPIIHRDIKPANVILGSDGRVHLVDFGTVQAEVARETGGSTIVGTAGYVAPEQLMGRAAPASDIYALGVTIASLLSGMAPTEFPRDGFELDVVGILETSPGLAYLVGRMTQADLTARESSIPTLREHLGRLATGQALVVHASTLPVALPAGSRLEVKEEGETLVVRCGARDYSFKELVLLRKEPGFLWLQRGITALCSVAILVLLVLYVLDGFGILAFPIWNVNWVLVLVCILLLPQWAFATLELLNPIQEWSSPRFPLKMESRFITFQSAAKVAWGGTTFGALRRRVPYHEITDVVARRSESGDMELHLLGENPVQISTANTELSDGEILWLAKLLRARLAQYRELEGSDG
jgi:serine/threonine protein kinase